MGSGLGSRGGGRGVVFWGEGERDGRGMGGLYLMRRIDVEQRRINPRIAYM